MLNQCAYTLATTTQPTIEVAKELQKLREKKQKPQQKMAMATQARTSTIN